MSWWKTWTLPAASASGGESVPFELVAHPDDGSDVITLTPGKTATGFKENRSYRIELPSTDYTLVIDDQEFRSDDGTVRWTSGFFAGTVAAELLDPNGQTVESCTLDVSPHPDKLGSEVFRSMLEELWQFDPALVIDTEPSTRNVGITGTYESDWLTYARLRRYADDYLAALARIALHPLRKLRTRREHVPLTRVRRADRLTGLSIQRQSVLLAAVRGEDVGVSVAALRLDIPVTEETLDSAANRLMVWQASAIAWRVERLIEGLEPKAQSGLESETRTALANRWPRRRAFLNDIGTRLDRLRRRSILREVTHPEMTVAGLNAVSADPAYGRAWRLGWCILRRGIEGEIADERLWISPTWEIYERWCFVRVAQWLTDTRAVEWSPRGEKNASDSRTLKGHDRGRRRFDLHLQPTFLAHDTRGQSGRWSISRERIPDILLRIDNGSRNVVLDAKYRTTRANVLEAMASAHIYRDALRIDGNRIDSALLLVPRSGGALWLEDPAFIREHSVGVVELSPGADRDGLTSVIGEFMAAT